MCTPGVHSRPRLAVVTWVNSADTSPPHTRGNPHYHHQLFHSHRRLVVEALAQSSGCLTAPRPARMAMITTISE